MTFFSIILFLNVLGTLLLLTRILFSLHKEEFTTTEYQDDTQLEYRVALIFGMGFGILFGILLGAMQANMLYAHLPLAQEISKGGMICVSVLFCISALTGRDIPHHITAWVIGCIFLVALIIGEIIANGMTPLLVASLVLLIGKLGYGAKKIYQSPHHA